MQPRLLPNEYVQRITSNNPDIRINTKYKYYDAVFDDGDITTEEVFKDEYNILEHLIKAGELPERIDMSMGLTIEAIQELWFVFCKKPEEKYGSNFITQEAYDFAYNPQFYNEASLYLNIFDMHNYIDSLPQDPFKSSRVDYTIFTNPNDIMEELSQHVLTSDDDYIRINKYCRNMHNEIIQVDNNIMNDSNEMVKLKIGKDVKGFIKKLFKVQELEDYEYYVGSKSLAEWYNVYAGLREDLGKPLTKNQINEVKPYFAEPQETTDEKEEERMRKKSTEK